MFRLFLSYALRKNLEYLKGTLSAQDQALVSLMLIQPEEQLQLAQPYKQEDCLLWERPIINFDGSAGLCCAVYDYQYNIADNFLDVSHTELDARKKTHQMCKICMNKGLHQVAVGAARSELDIIIQNSKVEKIG